jgi:hypothetical protein
MMMMMMMVMSAQVRPSLARPPGGDYRAAAGPPRAPDVAADRGVLGESRNIRHAAPVSEAVQEHHRDGGVRVPVPTFFFFFFFFIKKSLFLILRRGLLMNTRVFVCL